MFIFDNQLLILSNLSKYLSKLFTNKDKSVEEFTPPITKLILFIWHRFISVFGRLARDLYMLRRTEEFWSNKITIRNTLYKSKSISIRNLINCKASNEWQKYPKLWKKHRAYRHSGKLIDGSFYEYLQGLIFVTGAKLINFIRVQIMHSVSLKHSIDTLDKNETVGNMWCLKPNNFDDMKTPHGIERILNQGIIANGFILSKDEHSELYYISSKELYTKDCFRTDIPNLVQSLIHMTFEKVPNYGFRIKELNFKNERIKREQLTRFHCDVILNYIWLLTTIIYHVGITHYILGEFFLVSTEEHIPLDDPLRVILQPLMYKITSLSPLTETILINLNVYNTNPTTVDGNLKALNRLSNKKIVEFFEHPSMFDDDLQKITYVHDYKVLRKEIKKFVEDFFENHISKINECYLDWVKENDVFSKTKFEHLDLLEKMKKIIEFGYLNLVHHELMSNEFLIEFQQSFTCASPILREKDLKSINMSATDQQFWYLLGFTSQFENGIALSDLDSKYVIPEQYKRVFKNFCNSLRKLENENVFQHKVLKPSRIESSCRY